MDAIDEDYKQAYFRERTARIKAEQLIEDKSRVLYALNEELIKKVADLEYQQQLFIQAEKMATLGTLCAGVAHEINNPLAYAMSNVESLQQSMHGFCALLDLNQQYLTKRISETNFQQQLASLSEQQSFAELQQDIHQLVADSAEGLRRINQIVGNLLNFARPTTNKKQLADMTDAVKNALKLLKNQLKGCQLTTSITTLPLSYCDLATINQIMVNILINASHSCEALIDRQAHIHVQVDSDDQQIIISVNDNGCGMSEQVLAKVFDPFFTTKPVGRGTGMGMPLVYTMVNDHQGKIEIESTVNIGTCVRCIFPVLSERP